MYGVYVYMHVEYVFFVCLKNTWLWFAVQGYWPCILTWRTKMRTRSLRLHPMKRKWCTGETNNWKHQNARPKNELGKARTNLYSIYFFPSPFIICNRTLSTLTEKASPCTWALLFLRVFFFIGSLDRLLFEVSLRNQSINTTCNSYISQFLGFYKVSSILPIYFMWFLVLTAEENAAMDASRGDYLVYCRSNAISIHKCICSYLEMRGGTMYSVASSCSILQFCFV